MLAELRLGLECEQKLGILNGSIFQGVLMEQLERSFAESLHLDGLHPYSQHIEFSDKLYWVISVTNKESYEGIIEPLLRPDFVDFELTKKSAKVNVVSKALITKSHEELLKEFYDENTSRYITLEFLTPTSFKSNGTYVFIPTPRLVFGSLMRKYSGTSVEFEMNDDDTLEYLESNSSIASFRIKSLYYPLEGVTIPAFVGSITIRFTGTKTMMSYARLLAKFGEFSGVGIKCGMGMGAMRIIEKGDKN